MLKLLLSIKQARERKDSWFNLREITFSPSSTASSPPLRHPRVFKMFARNSRASLETPRQWNSFVTVSRSENYMRKLSAITMKLRLRSAIRTVSQTAKHQRLCKFLCFDFFKQDFKLSSLKTLMLTLNLPSNWSLLEQKWERALQSFHRFGFRMVSEPVARSCAINVCLGFTFNEQHFKWWISALNLSAVNQQ